jgi:hypothetical protein
MEAYFVLMVAALTSAVTLALEARRHSRPAAALRAAAAKATEAIGLTVVFFAFNLAAGALVTIAARALRITFISIYLTADVALLVLSLLQALVYQRWREGRKHTSVAGPST